MKHLMFSLLLVVLAVGMVNAQSMSASASLTLTGAGTALEIAALGEEIAIEGVVANTSYSVIANEDASGSLIFPVLNDVAEVDPLGFVVTANPLTDVQVSLILPSRLMGSASYVPINFPSMVRAENMAMYNPNVVNTFTVNADGAVTLVLNYNFTVPKVMEEEGWTGNVVAIASYM